MWRPSEDPSSHQLIVADRSNHRLQCFSLSSGGSYVRTIGQSGSGVGQIQQPWAMKVHHTTDNSQEDLIITIGRSDARVHIFSLATGSYLRLLCSSGKGSGVGQLNSNIYGIALHRPCDTASESETEIIISDYSNNRLQVYNLHTGVFIRTVSGGLSSPLGISMI